MLTATKTAKPVIKFVKDYGNHIGRRFYQFSLALEDGGKLTVDIVYRDDFRAMPKHTKADAKKLSEQELLLKASNLGRKPLFR